MVRVTAFLGRSQGVEYLVAASSELALRIPQLAICSWSTRRFTSLSSTINARNSSQVGDRNRRGVRMRVEFQRQSEPECGAFAMAAADADRAAHQFHELFGDRQPQAGAAVLPGGRTIGLAEFLETAPQSCPPEYHSPCRARRPASGPTARPPISHSTSIRT